MYDLKCLGSSDTSLVESEAGEVTNKANVII